MGYGDKLKQNTDKIKTEEKIFDESTETKGKGRPKKKASEVRNKAVPIAFTQKEIDWIDDKAKEMSKQLNIKVTASAWMRMKILADMPKEEE